MNTICYSGDTAVIGQSGHRSCDNWTDVRWKDYADFTKSAFLFGSFSLTHTHSLPVLQCRILSQARPQARNTLSPRGLRVRRPHAPPPQPVTWLFQWCSSLRGSLSEPRFSHTDNPPSAEPLNTSGPWDCGGHKRHSCHGDLSLYPVCVCLCTRVLEWVYAC